MDQAAAKQQIVEKIKQASNILVTVSNNPSVDQLAACIGMTLFLNKLDKHATAVFSGKVPDALEFLQPSKTIESNTDSLRDFIISLDKAKADKLRYKVEDKFVRIYITPYRTSLNEKDLVFSEGDFNVEVVLALGVRDKSQLDAAITQHGRILHDATVISMNSGKAQAPEIGQINWQDASSSSLSEMLVSISEAFGTGLIDGQMATAFLTGIVAETARFSNPKTSPKVMTMAAQLMAAGADQQLIVSKLEPPSPEAGFAVKPNKPPQGSPSDTLSISHDEAAPKLDELQSKPGEIKIDKYGNIVGSKQPANLLYNASASVKPNIPAASAPQPAPAAPPAGPAPPVSNEPALPPQQPIPPIINKPKIEHASQPIDQGHHFLDQAAHQRTMSVPFTADTQPTWADSENAPAVDPLNEATIGQGAPTFPTPTVGDARNAVQSAIAGAPFSPSAEGPITSLNANPIPLGLQSEYASWAEPGKGTTMPPEVVTEPPRPAPPPVPPPLRLDSGELIPTTATVMPVKEAQANSSMPTPAK